MTDDEIAAIEYYAYEGNEETIQGNTFVKYNESIQCRKNLDDSIEEAQTNMEEMEERHDEGDEVM